MNRRGFLSTLLTTSIAAAFDPERLLWSPSRKKIFIPPPRRVEIIDMDWGRDLALDMEPYSLPPKFVEAWADFIASSIDQQAADFALGLAVRQYRSVDRG